MIAGYVAIIMKKCMTGIIEMIEKKMKTSGAAGFRSV